MSQDEKTTETIIGVCSDILNVVRAWEAIKVLFVDYANALAEALMPFAETSNVGELPDLSAAKLEELFKQMDESSASLTGTSPKKYGISLWRRSQRILSYNYIPRVPRNLPYQRRAF